MADNLIQKCVKLLVSIKILIKKLLIYKISEISKISSHNLKFVSV